MKWLSSLFLAGSVFAITCPATVAIAQVESSNLLAGGSRQTLIAGFFDVLDAAEDLDDLLDGDFDDIDAIDDELDDIDDQFDDIEDAIDDADDDFEDLSREVERSVDDIRDEVDDFFD